MTQAAAVPNLATHPTPHRDVNAVLYLLSTSAQAVLGERFVGMYLYGSLAGGDFDPRRSDVDFVVVTAGELPDDAIAALETMHARIAASGLKWAAKLEGSYVPQHTLRRYDPAHTPCPQVNEGRFYVAGHGSDWIIQRYILREQGVAVAGPALRPLIDPVSPDDLRQAVRGILREWWAPMIEEPDRLRSGEYQAYAVLTMCRALHTLAHGTVASKPAAARWAQQTLDQRWSALIGWACAWQPGTPPDRFDDALEFIRYALERARRFETVEAVAAVAAADDAPSGDLQRG